MLTATLPPIPAARLICATSNANGDFYALMEYPNGRKLTVKGDNEGQEWYITDSLGYHVAGGATEDCEAAEVAEIARTEGGFALV